MIYDLGVLLRLIRLRLRRKGIYWLKLLGISQNESRWFYLYALAYAVFWFTAMWSLLVDTIYRASQEVLAEWLVGLHTVAPIVWMVGAGFLFILSLRSLPLRFAGPHTLLLASSPVKRSVLVLLSLYEASFAKLVIGGGIGYVLVLFLNSSIGTQVGIAALQALVVVPLLLLIIINWNWSLAIAWATGEGGRWQTPLLERGSTWLLSGALLVATLLLLGLSSLLLAAILDLSFGLAESVLLSAMLLISHAALLWVSGSLSMTLVITNSDTFARLARLNPLFAADLYARIRFQAHLSKRTWRIKWPELSSLPPEVVRASHMIANHSPGMPLRLFLFGSGYASILLFVASTELGTAQINLLVFFMMMLIANPPKQLVAPYRQLFSHRWLRQFHHTNNLLLFVQDTSLPILLASLGVLLVTLVQQQSLVGGLMIAGGIVLLLILLALCQVMPLVRLRGFIIKRLAYEHALLFCAFCLVVVLYLTHSLSLVVLTSMVLVAGYSVLLYRSG